MVAKMDSLPDTGFPLDLSRLIIEEKQTKISPKKNLNTKTTHKKNRKESK